MNTASLPSFVAIGEALTDLITQGDPGHGSWLARTGGAGWNVARAMARLGVPSAFAGAISQDVFGQALWDGSAAAGLDMRFVQRVAKAPLLAIVHCTAPPAYFFIGDDSADLHFDPQQLPQGWQTQVQWAHFGGISLARPPLAWRLLRLARELKAQGVRICFDPNYRTAMELDSGYSKTLRDMAKLADVIKVSDEDLVGLFRSSDNADTAAHLATLRSWNPQALCLVTHGELGATLYAGTQQWSTKPPAVTVVDTVGAGDASMAALLASLMQQPEAEPAEHLRYAVAGGAAACQQMGASPPCRQDIEGLLAQA